MTGLRKTIITYKKNDYKLPNYYKRIKHLISITLIIFGLLLYVMFRNISDNPLINLSIWVFCLIIIVIIGDFLWARSMIRRFNWSDDNVAPKKSGENK